MLTAETLDLEAVLPIADMRAHTKTDDMPSVTDTQLRLYRRAAFEACEQFTGRKWLGRERVVQSIARPESALTRGRQTCRVSLNYPTDDGVIVVAGRGGGRDVNRTIVVMPGARTIDLPVLHTAIDVSDCCGGCNEAVNYGLTITYTTGACKPDQIPAGILLGCLKFIAWAIENPGDQLVTVAGVRTSGQELAGTNNGAWGSGALELWRQYRTGIAS